jgi:hypothetical protein
MGRPSKLPGAEAPSKVIRVCGAEGCGEKIRGSDLAKHYKVRTDFKTLDKLNKLSVEEATVQLADIDSHTAYMFVKRKTAENLPDWRTHKPAAKPIPGVFLKKPDANQNENKESDSEEEDQEPPAKKSGGPGIRDKGDEDDELQLPDAEGSDEDEDKDEADMAENQGDDVQDQDEDRTEAIAIDESAEEEDVAAEIETNSLLKQVKEALKKQAGLTPEVMEELTEKIANRAAAKTVELMKLEQEKKVLEQVKVEETWIEGDTMMTCRPCAKYSDGDEVRQKEKLENKFYPGDCGDSRQHYEPSRGEEQVTFKIVNLKYTAGAIKTGTPR